MKKKVKKYFINFTLLILALQILNMSISCRIADESFFSELHSSVNITDHAVEFIVEDVLGYTNAFPEATENQQQHNVYCTQKVQVFTFFSFSLKPIVQNYQLLAARKYCTFIVSPYNQYVSIITLPPKAMLG